MNMKVALAASSVITPLLGVVCPMQMTAAMPMPEPIQHMEVTEVAMTPTLPMTLAVPMSMAPTTHASTMPVFPSGNCTTRHCVTMDHSNQQPAAVSTFTLELMSTEAPVALQLPVAVLSDAIPAPPDARNGTLAQTIATVVLRV